MFLTFYVFLNYRWSVIAAHLPERTDNDIKNYWHTRLKRRVKLNPISEVTAESSVSFQPKPNQKEKFNETSLSERKKRENQNSKMLSLIPHLTRLWKAPYRTLKHFLVIFPQVLCLQTSEASIGLQKI